jgi:DNA polymerase
MKKLALPRKRRKSDPPDSPNILWHDDPKLIATLFEYNRVDVEMTAEIIRLIGLIPPAEQAIWQLDEAINQRGIHLNRGLLDAALQIAGEASEELATRLSDLTSGAIDSAQQTDRILQWLSERGCPLENLQKPSVTAALEKPDLTPEVRQVLELRADGAHASVNKFTTLRRWLSSDDRIRYAYRYWGASPGRWSSVGCQLQNLRKPSVSDVPAAIAAVQTGSLAEMRARYERPLDTVGDITRALVTAAPGRRPFIADLSGIESRGLAWITNETTKLDQWREFDRTGKAEDEPYFQIGTRDFELEGSIARKTGKAGDLAFQYQDGIPAWRRLAPAGDSTADATVLARQKKWRQRHPAIEKFWKVSVRQAVNAIEHPGERFTVARIAFVYEKPFLRLELPCGRSISFPFARLYETEDSARSFTFRDTSGGRWEWYHVLKRRGAFGGLLAENATQALCRDIFAEALLRLEARGYRPVAHLHDEFICEAPDGFGSLDEFRAIITEPPAWAPDFPVACKGRIAHRFIEGAEEIAPLSPHCAATKPNPRRPIHQFRHHATTIRIWMMCRSKTFPRRLVRIN